MTTSNYFTVDDSGTNNVGKFIDSLLGQIRQQYVPDGFDATYWQNLVEAAKTYYQVGEKKLSFNEITARRWCWSILNRDFFIYSSFFFFENSTNFRLFR